MRLLRLTMAMLFTVAMIHPSAITFCSDRPGIVYKIARVEGFYVPGSIPDTHHNPGNLVFTHQPGAKPGAHGQLPGKLRFAKFKTDAEGWLALEMDLAKKKYRKSAMRKAWTWMK